MPIKENYRNLFAEIGISQSEIDKKLEYIKQQYFYGDDKVYFPVGEDMGYIMDTGNYDARTEGMSYGMMICVQMDMKEEFDRIWKWSKTYMYMDEGENEGYFAWSCKTDGTKNAYGPAPDGEEYFAMALFFASHRWGDGEGIFEYSKEAKNILSAMIHKGSDGRKGAPMFNNENHQILFVPGSPFTDPSYHLPHFYELFSKWAYEEDRAFFAEAARVSREYLVSACDPNTGFSAEYACFDGSPYHHVFPWGRHDWFYSDAYRTAANISLDYEWFKNDVGQIKACENMMKTLWEDYKNDELHIYEVDGTVAEPKALHPVAILATVAEGALTMKNSELSEKWVRAFFETPLRTGERRYYDNCLFFFAYLALSGNYRIW